MSVSLQWSSSYFEKKDEHLSPVFTEQLFAPFVRLWWHHLSKFWPKLCVSAGAWKGYRHPGRALTSLTTVKNIIFFNGAGAQSLFFATSFSFALCFVFDNSLRVHVGLFVFLYFGLLWRVNLVVKTSDWSQCCPGLEDCRCSYEFWLSWAVKTKTWFRWTFVVFLGSKGYLGLPFNIPFNIPWFFGSS